MDLFGIGSMMGAVTDGIIGGLNYAEQKKTNKQNLALQREQFEYQKQLQQKMMDREDSAIQRRAEDLKKSGMNPMLAATTNGASAGANAGMIQMSGTEAPQLEANAQAKVDMIYNSMKTKEDIATTKAQRDLTAAQQASEIARELNIREDTQVKSKQKQLFQQQYEEAKYNYNKYKAWGLPVGFKVDNKWNAGQAAFHLLSDGVQAIRQADKAADTVIDAIDKYNPGFKKHQEENRRQEKEIWYNYAMP